MDIAYADGIREMMAVIALPNDGSEAFHRECGFVACGKVERAGKKFGALWDIAFYQRQLKPTTIAGLDDILEKHNDNLKKKRT